MLPKHIIKLEDIEIEVSRKSVKNLNIRIYPSQGRVAMSIPKRSSLRTAEAFAKKKYEWIKKHLSGKRHFQVKNGQSFKFQTGEEHFIWGERQVLVVQEKSQKPDVKVLNGKIVLTVRPGSSCEKREWVLNEWYRAQLKSRIPILVLKWEKKMGVEVNEFGVKKMKTRWGTCNIRAKRIWLNLELAKRDTDCLEYVVVHEMVHLLERLHSKRFYRLMDYFLPDWKLRDERLKVNGLRC